MGKEMALQAFIEKMKAGWGFQRPYRVCQIGHALEEIFRGRTEDLQRIVDVDYQKSTSGYRPNVYVHYTWTVKGATLPFEGQVRPGAHEAVFGYTRRELPEFRNIDGGFQVGYTW
jgi:hypothetical protein